MEAAVSPTAVVDPVAHGRAGDGPGRTARDLSFLLVFQQVLVVHHHHVRLERLVVRRLPFLVVVVVVAMMVVVALRLVRRGQRKQQRRRLRVCGWLHVHRLRSSPTRQRQNHALHDAMGLGGWAGLSFGAAGA